MAGVPAEKLPAAALSEHRQLLRWLVQAGRHSSAHHVHIPGLAVLTTLATIQSSRKKQLNCKA
jgi:hypothetical protein